MVENSVRFSAIKKIVWFVFFLNLIVALSKIILGLISKSASITADGFHSTGDAMDNIIGIIGINLASKPKDKDHAYGHEKYESLASFIVGIILLILAVNVVRDSIARLMNPKIPKISILSFLIIATTVLINIFVSIYEFNKGKKLGSEFLIADSLHTRSDIFVSISVIATIFFVRLGYFTLDTIVSIVIAVVIALAGIRVLRSSSQVLTDSEVLNSVELQDIVMGIPEVIDCHAVRTRGTLSDIKIDLHITVDKGMSVNDAHEVADRVENAVREKFGSVSEVIVHIEPFK